MVSAGQCQAAANFCPNVPDKLKEHLEQEEVGHYGIFSGSRYRQFIAPAVKDFIKRHNGKRTQARKAPAKAA